jgi:signal transduction histidine kinase
MLLSQAMLVVIVISWLYAQYNDQKEQLAQSLKVSLKEAEEIHTDSLLSNILGPSVQSGSIRFTPDSTHTRTKHARSKRAVSMFIATDKDSLKVKEITQEITETNGKDSVHIKIRNNGKQQTTILDPSIVMGSKEAKPALEFILKQLVIKDGGIAKELNFTIDTLIIKQLFAKELAIRDQHFTVVWKNAKKYHAAHDSKPILLQSTLFTTNYNVAIDDYDSYLIKKLIPQILFIIFLLGLTATAFIFTYNTLREQIRLGVIKNEFISNMSHELKTPISTVKVALEAISNFNPISDTQTTRDYLQMATLETERLEMLVNQALNTSLLEDGKMVVQREPYSLELLVSRTLQAMQVRFKQYNAQVNVHVTAINTTASIDTLHIQGVLINLLDNSLKYSNTIPVITINIDENSNHLFLSVADNGPGIPQEYLGKVFDKFFRVPMGDKHNVKGYGLGLSYVKQVVSRHNGTIIVKNLDKGCVFTISLPKA